MTREVQGTGEAAERLFPPVQQSTSALKGFLAAGSAIVVLGLAKQTLAITDAYAGLQTRFRTATKGTGDYVEVSRELLAISVENGTALETTVSVFQNLARTAPELQASNRQILELTRLTQQLGVISGSTQSQMQAGLLQFTQGLAGGVFRAEEFNSIIENLPAGKIGRSLSGRDGHGSEKKILRRHLPSRRAAGLPRAITSPAAGGNQLSVTSRARFCLRVSPHCDPGP